MIDRSKMDWVGEVKVSEFVSCVMVVGDDEVYFSEGFGWCCKREMKSEEERKELMGKIKKSLKGYLKLMK